MADFILILPLRMDLRYLSLLYTFSSLNVIARQVQSQVKVIRLAIAYPKQRDTSLRFETIDIV